MAVPSRLSAAAGTTAPVLFVALVLVQELLQPDYSRVALPISALAAWPLGWLQNLNFIVFGVLLLVFILGLERGVAPSRGGRVGTALLLVGALGALIAGLFPWIRLDGRPMATTEHIIGAMMHFLGSALGLIVFSRRLAVDPKWQNISTYVLDSGIAMLMLFLATAFLAVGPGRPLHGWGGMLQRVTVAVWFTLLIVLAMRLRHVTDESPPTHSA